MISSDLDRRRPGARTASGTPFTDVASPGSPAAPHLCRASRHSETAYYPD